MPLATMSQNSQSTTMMLSALHLDDDAINVHTTAKNVVQRGLSPFTVYTFTVTCHQTSTWWILRKRYSQIFALRSTLLKWRKQCNATPGMAPLADLLTSMAAVEFPRRHICFDHPTIIRDRKRELQGFIAALIRLRQACHTLAQQPGAPRRKAQDVASLVLHFLEMPVAVEDEEHRLSCGRQLQSHTAPTDDACPICMCEFDELSNDDTVLELTCGHTFHESCLVHWLDKKMTCPLCRCEAVGGFIAA
ncbi:hypothetical protein SDRG_06902 [Saprolegnia diclina VS20]|uniref:RING-type domain-containing protein n=1 Tax=Saprolegnia diclina (strain VS20) TaxID=1156394 RepID=T0RT51_SAPDV|nr:hypothetical protein SDRG_06902 [Saprolegnia diclina VS20]EQC35618.1 hypothetical protein SDRG_06902 [Saprolegnia diclina VS20]|eukprot:XP_008610935.1 hypothetical protein SDRG_06902 [Saprolegnia diclina VS20]